MTWSPLSRDVTPAPTSTTMPAPSWPRIAGNSPSGSAPESVKASVWQTPVALISTSTSPALGAADFDGLDGERLSGLPGDGGARFHGGFPEAAPAPIARAGRL